MVKFTDSCLKIKPPVAFYSVSINILFFKKEKKEYIILGMEMYTKLHVSRNSHLKETGFERVSLMHGTYKSFHNRYYLFQTRCNNKALGEPEIP